jgi:Domain of unknown function (DUF4331)
VGAPRARYPTNRAKGVRISKEYSAADLRFPGDDERLDLTDLYVFAAPLNQRETVLIIRANRSWSGVSSVPPFLVTSGFHPDAVYRINVDNDGDGEADVAFSFVFSEPAQRLTRVTSAR